MLRCDFLLDLHMPYMNISCDKQANINLDKWESKKASQEIIFTQAGRHKSRTWKKWGIQDFFIGGGHKIQTFEGWLMW